jgi:hypothetical protein
MLVFGLGTGRCGTLSLQSLLNAQQGVACFHELNPGIMAWQGALPSVLCVLNGFTGILTGRELALPLDLVAAHRTDRDGPMRTVSSQTRPAVVGDVASYYLPYVEDIIQRVAKVRFVCLRREKAATAASFINKIKVVKELPKKPRLGVLAVGKQVVVVHKNHWADHDGSRYEADPRWDKCFPNYDARLDLETAIGMYWDEYYNWAAKLQTKHAGVFRVFDVEDLNRESGRAASR